MMHFHMIIKWYILTCVFTFFQVKLAGVVLIYCGISYRELSMSLVIGFCLANAAYKLNGNLEFINQMRYVFKPLFQYLFCQNN